MAPTYLKQPIKAPHRIFELIIIDGEIMPMANQIAQGPKTTLNCTVADPMLKLASDNSIEREVDVDNDEIMLTFIFKDKSELVLCITR